MSKKRNLGDSLAMPLFTGMEALTGNVKDCGLSIRELFAAMAMQGILAAMQNPHWNGVRDANRVAKAAVISADALIRQLTKEKS